MLSVDQRIKLRTQPFLIKKRLTATAIARQITEQGRPTNPAIVSAALAGTRKPPRDVARMMAEIFQVRLSRLFPEWFLDSEEVDHGG